MVADGTGGNKRCVPLMNLLLRVRCRADPEDGQTAVKRDKPNNIFKIVI